MIGSHLRRSALLMAAVGATSVLAFAGPAAAATDDGFSASTTDGCGVTQYVDYGTLNGSGNDDFILVHDYCPDGHGVRAYAWQNGTYLGSKYNGNGKAGAAVGWDPFKSGNVAPGDDILLEACLVDGSGDTTPSKCQYAENTSFDG